MMMLVKRLATVVAIMSLAAGCTKDVREISDLALVMITGIDYDARQHKFLFTSYCILPSVTSIERSSKQHEWVASAQGSSIMDAARNLRSRAGKTLIWQHDKFFVIGEEAARHAFYEIVDFMTRSREIRMSSYVIVSEGKAADKLTVKSETNDLVSNDFLGRTMNEDLWGKSVALMAKDVSNWFADPYRGFVTGKVSLAKPVGGGNEVLFLSGGSVFHKGKLVDWMSANDALTVHLLSKKKEWRKLEFPTTVDFQSAQVTLLMQYPRATYRLRQSDGGPALDVNLRLKAALIDMDRQLKLLRPELLTQLEQAAARQMERTIEGSLNRFQRSLQVDVIGFSDYIRVYHPREWNRIKERWDQVYAAMPVHVHVDVRFTRIGMSKTMEGP